MRRAMLLATALLLAAGPASGGTVRDMLDREVRVPDRPERVVSLAPSLTEIVYALGAEGMLVGVTTFCDYPPEAAQKPKVGGIVNPSLEAILALRPDLVLATTEGNRESTVQELERVGLPTYVVRPKTFSTVLDTITRVGHLLGREQAARRVAADLRRRATRVVATTRGRPRPSVLYLVWTDPVIAPGRDTLITDLIRMAGGASVSAEERIEWPRLSLEQVVAKAPEVIIMATHSQTYVDATLQRWREQRILLPALRDGRVHAIDGNLTHRPGPRIVDGLEALARAIHPEVLP